MNQTAEVKPYIIRTYDRWIILAIVLVVGWFLFRPIFAFVTYYRGVSFERMLRLHTAEHYYKKSIGIYPRIPEPWLGLGELYYFWTPGQPEYYPLTVQVFTRGLSYNPDSVPLAFYLGRAYFRAKNYRKAMAALRRCIALAPKDRFCLDYAAWAAIGLGDRALALKYWHRLLVFHPADEPVRNAVRLFEKPDHR